MAVYGVTGGTGFLGGHLIDRLIADGHTVQAFVRNPVKAARLAERGVLLTVGDITDRDAAAAAFAGCDVVVHSAAALDGAYDDQHIANVDGTRAVMLAAADAEVRRVLHISTVAVYAAPLTGVLTEDSPTRPGQYAYAVTKQMAENVVRQIAAQRGIDYSIIRPGMIYGPGAGLWTAGLARLARQPTIPFPLGGRGNAPAVFAADVVDLVCTAATHPAAAGQVFNAVGDPAITWRDWLTAYARLGSHDPRWIDLPRPLMTALAGIIMAVSPPASFGREAVDMLTFVQSNKTFSMAKARDVLGWRPHYTIEAGAAACAGWLREQGIVP